MDINTVIDKLDLSEADKKSVSVIFSRKVFKKVMDKIIQIKRDVIGDEVKTLEGLERMRFTKIGNEEVYKIFEGINSIFESENKPKEDFNPQDMI